MAGYIINLDNLESLSKYIENGVYSTKLSMPNGYWRTNHEGTFADYVTMKERDNIYFFINRKIFGIGELININVDCKYCNYPNSCIPNNFDYDKIKKKLLWDEDDYSANQRWVCLFKPSPFFFINGIDMDDVLSSNPSSFRMLRAFWKLSFLKIDDQENQALKDVILKFNQEALNENDNKSKVFSSNFNVTHRFIEKKLLASNYSLNMSDFLFSCNNENYLKHEMAIEAGILHQLCYNFKETIRIFGNWDYLSHQVVASPFKPIDYMDKMDIFGYSYISGFIPTRSNYIVIEIKKDECKNENIDQLLKYVDWVRDEYCHGDYSMIKAFLVSFNFDEEVKNYRNKFAIRYYTLGRRPAKSEIWNDLSLIKYRFNEDEKFINFEEVI